MSERSEILDTARYLREVRPVDPEEIFEYISTAPHPAVVRQTLREAMFELGVREQADGTFVSVESGPVEVPATTIEAFPDSHTRRFENLLVETYGAGWADGASGRHLREHLREMKEAYFAGENVDYDRDTALAYACYHLPDYYAAVQYPLMALANDGLLPRRCRVLEVGAGVGGPALGIHDLVGDETLVEYHAVEASDAAADVFEQMVDDTRPGFQSVVHRATAETFAPETVFDEETYASGTDERGPTGFDLILFGNVLSELDAPQTVAREYADCLAEDGSMILLAPADRNTAIGLRNVERGLADSGPLTVYEPTVRLWPNERPTDRGWSFDLKPDLDIPGFQRELDRPAGGDGEFINVDVQYAYATLRGDGRTAVEARPIHTQHAKLADSEANVTQRIDFLALKLSHDLSEGGNPLFKISDGSESVDHYAVLTRSSVLNDTLVTAKYGDILGFENALVLWNDDEKAYNLVVDGETVIDQVG
jgi:SAM-dependent methyltransferase